MCANLNQQELGEKALYAFGKQHKTNHLICYFLIRNATIFQKLIKNLFHRNNLEITLAVSNSQK